MTVKLAHSENETQNSLVVISEKWKRALDNGEYV